MKMDNQNKVVSESLGGRGNAVTLATMPLVGFSSIFSSCHGLGIKFVSSSDELRLSLAMTQNATICDGAEGP